MSNITAPISILGKPIPLTQTDGQQSQAIHLKSGPTQECPFIFLPYTTAAHLNVPPFDHPLDILVTSNNTHLDVGIKIAERNANRATPDPPSTTEIYQTSFTTTCSVLPNSIAIMQYPSSPKSKIYISFLTTNACLNLLILSFPNTSKSPEFPITNVNFVSNRIGNALDSLDIPKTVQLSALSALLAPYFAQNPQAVDVNPPISSLSQVDLRNPQHMEIIHLLTLTTSLTLNEYGREVWLLSSPFSSQIISLTLVYDDTDLILCSYSAKRSSGLLESLLSPLFSLSSSSSSSPKATGSSQHNAASREVITTLPTAVSLPNSDQSASMAFLSHAALTLIEGAFLALDTHGNLYIFDSNVDEDAHTARTQGEHNQFTPRKQRSTGQPEPVTPLTILGSLQLHSLPEHICQNGYIYSARITVEDPYSLKRGGPSASSQQQDPRAPSPVLTGSKSIHAMVSCVYFDPQTCSFSTHVTCIAICLQNTLLSMTMVPPSQQPPVAAVHPLPTPVEGQSPLILAPLFSSTQTLSLPILPPSRHLSTTSVSIPLVKGLTWSPTRAIIQFQYNGIYALEVQYDRLPRLYEFKPEYGHSGNSSFIKEFLESYPQSSSTRSILDILSGKTDGTIAVSTTTPVRPINARASLGAGKKIGDELAPTFHPIILTPVEVASPHATQHLLLDEVTGQAICYTCVHSQSTSPHRFTQAYTAPLLPLDRLATATFAHDQLRYPSSHRDDTEHLARQMQSSSLMSLSPSGVFQPYIAGQKQSTLLTVQSTALIAHLISILNRHPTATAYNSPSEPSVQASFQQFTQLIHSLQKPPTNSSSTGGMSDQIDASDLDSDNCDDDDHDDDLENLFNAFPTAQENGIRQREYDFIVSHVSQFIHEYVPSLISTLYSSTPSSTDADKISYNARCVNETFVRWCIHRSTSSNAPTRIEAGQDPQNPPVDLTSIKIADTQETKRFTLYAQVHHHILALILTLAPLYLETPSNYTPTMSIMMMSKLALDIHANSTSLLTFITTTKNLPPELATAQPQSDQDSAADQQNQSRLSFNSNTATTRRSRRSLPSSTVNLSFDSINTSFSRLADNSEDADSFAVTRSQAYFHYNTSVSSAVMAILQMVCYTIFTPQQKPSSSENNPRSAPALSTVAPLSSTIYKTLDALQQYGSYGSHGLSQASLNSETSFQHLDKLSDELFKPLATEISTIFKFGSTNTDDSPHNSPQTSSSSLPLALFSYNPFSGDIHQQNAVSFQQQLEHLVPSDKSSRDLFHIASLFTSHTRYFLLALFGLPFSVQSSIAQLFFHSHHTDDSSDILASPSTYSLLSHYAEDIDVLLDTLLPTHVLTKMLHSGSSSMDDDDEDYDDDDHSSSSQPSFHGPSTPLSLLSARSLSSRSHKGVHGAALSKPAVKCSLNTIIGYLLLVRLIAHPEDSPEASPLSTTLAAGIDQLASTILSTWHRALLAQFPFLNSPTVLAHSSFDVDNDNRSPLLQIEHAYGHILTLLHTVWMTVDGLTQRFKTSTSNSVDIPPHSQTSQTTQLIVTCASIAGEIYAKLAPPPTTMQPLVHRLFSLVTAVYGVFTSRTALLFSHIWCHALMTNPNATTSDFALMFNPPQDPQMFLDAYMSLIQPLWDVSLTPPLPSLGFTPSESAFAPASHHDDSLLTYGLAIYTLTIRMLLRMALSSLLPSSTSTTASHAIPRRRSQPTENLLESFLIGTRIRPSKSQLVARAFNHKLPSTTVWNKKNVHYLFTYVSTHLISSMYHYIISQFPFKITDLDWIDTIDDADETEIQQIQSKLLTNIDKTVALLFTLALPVGELLKTTFSDMPSTRTTASGITIPSFVNYHSILESNAALTLSGELGTAAEMLLNQSSRQVTQPQYATMSTRTWTISIVSLYMHCVLFNQDILCRFHHHYDKLATMIQDVDRPFAQYIPSVFYPQYQHIVAINNQLLLHIGLLTTSLIPRIPAFSLITTITAPIIGLQQPSTIALTPFSLQCLISIYSILSDVMHSRNNTSIRRISTLYNLVVHCFYDDPFPFVEFLIDNNRLADAANLMTLFSGHAVGYSLPAPAPAPGQPDDGISSLQSQQENVSSYGNTLLLSESQLVILSKKLLGCSPQKPHENNITATLPGFNYSLAGHDQTTQQVKHCAICHGLWHIRTTPLGQSLLLKHLPQCTLGKTLYGNMYQPTVTETLPKMM